MVCIDYLERDENQPGQACVDQRKWDSKPHPASKAQRTLKDR